MNTFKKIKRIDDYDDRFPDDHIKKYMLIKIKILNEQTPKMPDFTYNIQLKYKNNEHSCI